jgi:hypothetical protein
MSVYLVQRDAETRFLGVAASNCRAKITARPPHLAEIVLMTEKLVEGLQVRPEL